MSYPRRGEVYWVALDPVVGSEIAKTRPGLVISNDLGNQFSPRVIVAPLTSAGLDRVYPFEVRLQAGEAGIDRDSKALLNHIRTVDKQRLGRLVGTATETTMAAVDIAIRLSLGLE